MDDPFSDQPVAIGIDFGGTTVKLGLVQAGGLTVRAESLPTLAYDSGEHLLTAILESIDDLRARHPGVQAVGVGLPGIIDSRRGIVHHLTNVAGWVNIPLREILSLHTGLPAIIENDANAMTYAEWKYGAARGRENVVCVTLGTGVGGGLILNGQLFRGSRLGAGEIGNMSIDYRGRPYEYGNFGALEAYVGNAHIAERAHAMYTAAGQTRSILDCLPVVLAEAALRGDEVARAEHHPSFVPELAGDLLFTPLLRTIRERTSPIFYEQLEVLPAKLGSDAGLIGSGALALDALPV